KLEWAIALRERVLRKFPGLQIAGIHHGYFGSMHASVIEAINDSAADIVMVGMGSPLQETWLAQHRDQMHPPFVMTVGAYISFLSDELPRAPQILRALRLEWFYRLCLEPGRLWKRYLVGGLVFAWLVVRARMRKK
ncbi:MAG: WecB/TagA/CpsF family glycosyltransferase, partial [Ignavibacteriales bacterium]|nr:WecB/TagA/CpsF family glycosyltransferase [Ignavibacteriales bacterium]